MAAYRVYTVQCIAAVSAMVLVPTLRPSPSAASTPTLMWSNVQRLNIVCNVAGGPGIDHIALAAQLCRSVQNVAAQGAPVPVRTIVLGDPDILASDAVTLLVHASVTFAPQGRLLAFAIRPYRTSSEPTAILFGAPPRAALLPGPNGKTAEFDAALGAALSETLPWLNQPSGPQRINRKQRK